MLILLRGFTQLRRDIRDRSLNGGDARFISVQPSDVFWWLKHGLDLESQAYIPSNGHGHNDHRRKAKQFERYVELVVGDRTKSSLVADYEERLRALDKQPWSGETVSEIVGVAKQIRDQEGTTTSAVVKSSLQHSHFETAMDQVLGQDHDRRDRTLVTTNATATKAYRPSQTAPLPDLQTKKSSRGTKRKAEEVGLMEGIEHAAHASGKRTKRAKGQSRHE